jgi:hypothetical protein
MDTRKVIEWLVIVFYVAVACASLFFFIKVANTAPQLACSVAEISPDFDSQSRQKCRQIRGHKL